MKKATVYRIEHKETKQGMYFGPRSLYNIAGACGDDIYGEHRRHPHPREDSVLMSTDFYNLRDTSGLNYGFISIEQLRSWLYKDAWLIGLDAAGYVLAIIESEEVYVGSTQAVFLRPDEYPTFSIKEYFNLTEKEIHNDFDF